MSCLAENSPDVEIAGIRIFNGAAIEKGVLYIVNNPRLLRSLEEAESCAFLLVGPAAAMSRQLAITGSATVAIALIRPDSDGPKSIPPEQILERLFSLFISLQDWDLRLKDAYSEGAGYAKLFRIARELFDIPFALVDQNFTIIAYTPDFFTIRHESNLEEVPIDNINEMLLDGDEYYRTSTFREPYLYPSYPSPERWLCYNIFRGSHLEGRITAGGYSDIGLDQTPSAINGLIHLLAHFGDYVGKVFINTFDDMIVQKQGDSLHRLLRNCVAESMDMTEKNIAAILNEAGWQMNDSYTVIVVQIQDEREFEYGSLYLCRHLETDIVRSCAIPHESHIVWLVNNSGTEGTETKKQGSRFLRLITYIAREFNCRAGISNPCNDARELRNCYLQARAALQLGYKKSPEFWVYQFADYVLDYLIDRARGELSIGSLLHPGYVILRDIDKQQGASYVKTIRHFIEARYHTNLAAKNLFIHKTTLIRRLEKIQYLAGIDFENPDELLRLAISLKLQDCAD
ncbi:MAG: helix-turn-helix domain-containing protein [Spirochaetaceae bacterium]|nr:helix-turn-helix domain-containing protein [Spirochaetaceae bacterium]